MRLLECGDGDHRIRSCIARSRGVRACDDEKELATAWQVVAVLVVVDGGAFSTVLYSILGSIAAGGHMVAVVTFLVAATSGIDAEQHGLATGLVTMTQQVSMTLGTPIVSAITIAAGGLTSLFALRVGIGIDAAIVVVLMLLILVVLRRADGRRPTDDGRRRRKRHGSVRPRHETGSTVPNRAHSSDVRRRQ